MYSKKNSKSLRPQPPRTSLPKVAPNPISTRHDYDRESGLSYTEYEVSASQRRHTDWIGELKTPSLVRKSNANESGARSLRDVAASLCAKEMRNFTPEHLAFVPWAISERIWQEIERKSVVSTHHDE